MPFDDIPINFSNSSDQHIFDHVLLLFDELYNVQFIPSSDTSTFVDNATNIFNLDDQVIDDNE